MNETDIMARIDPIESKIDFKVLNAEQLDQIKTATLHVLENVGVRFPSGRALDIFSEHGAIVDRSSQVVKLPAEFVLTTMSKAPRTYTLS
jgi:trimethylamine:corrinoid methyltransferase-like protein